MINCDYIELEELDFIEFERKKLNFKKESLREYFFLAQKELS